MSVQLIPGPAYRGRQHIPMPPSELRGWTVRVGVPICSGFVCGAASHRWAQTAETRSFDRKEAGSP